MNLKYVSWGCVHLILFGVTALYALQAYNDSDIGLMVTCGLLAGFNALMAVLTLIEYVENSDKENYDE